MNIAVFVSGGGTNLQNIQDAINTGILENVKIVLVIADRNCYALERALDNDITTYLVDRGNEISTQIDEILSSYSIDFIVLGGFLSILNSNFCNKWANKIINIHPSLLPKYGGKGMYGEKVHQAVLDAGETESGATVHFVTSEVDEGKIILQKSFLILENDSVKDLQKKIQVIEKEILIKSIQMLCQS